MFYIYTLLQDTFARYKNYFSWCLFSLISGQTFSVIFVPLSFHAVSLSQLSCHDCDVPFLIFRVFLPLAFSRVVCSLHILPLRIASATMSFGWPLSS